jgi:hypothetical protein
MSEQPPQPSGKPEEAGVAEALRSAVERTLQATSPAASQTRQRAAVLLDEVSRVGREAGAEISRRGQEASAGISRRGQEISKRGQEAGQGLARIGQEATSELSKRLETLERRLASLEAGLKGADEGETKAKDEG